MSNRENYLKSELYALIKTDETIFDFIQESSLDGVLIFKNGRITYLSPSYESIFGYSFDDKRAMSEEDLYQLLHPDDAPRVRNKLYETIANGASSYVIEYRMMHKKGYYIWREEKVNIIFGEDQEFTLIVIARDITERTQREQALQDSREQILYKSGILSAISKTTENLLVSKNINETVQEALELIGKSTKVDRMYYFENDIKTNLVSHKNEWIAGNASIEINNPLLQNMTFDDLGEYMPKLLSNKPFVSFARNVKHPKVKKRLIDQGVVTILLMPIFIKNNFHGFIGFDDCNKERVWTEDELNILQSLVTNIANGIERINNELIIKESERNFRQINETIEDVFWLFDIRNNKVDYISPSCLKILGRSQQQFYNQTNSWTHFVVEEDHPLIHKTYEQLATKEYYEIEYRVKINHEIKWILEKSFAIKNDQGEIIKHSGICSDITDKVDKKNQLIRLLGVTSDQNKRLLNFAHIVSHNIRSHSSNLSMLVDFMQQAETKEEWASSFSMLRQSISRLADTIENLNEIITVQTNLNVPKTELFVKQEIDKVKGVLNTMILETKATLKVEIGAEASIKAIPAYMESILLNLMTNALKYRSPERAPKVNISMKNEDGFAVLSFRDNGLGLDLQKYGHKLFGMYKTFHSNKDARGIGLFITKNQIEAMGGRIEAESEVGIGSTFKVYFNEND